MMRFLTTWRESCTYFNVTLKWLSVNVPAQQFQRKSVYEYIYFEEEVKCSWNEIHCCIARTNKAIHSVVNLCASGLVGLILWNDLNLITYLPWLGVDNFSNA